jgi:uncharacterized protein
MEKLARIIIKLKWFVIIAVIGLTVFFTYQLKDITINADFINSLPNDDPIAKLYKDIGEKYTGNDMGMIVLETDNVFKTEVLEHVKQVTDSLRVAEGISTVTSLINVIDIKNIEDGIEIGNLINEYDLPDTKEELDSLKEYVSSKEMYNGSIVSEDGTATLIVFTLLPEVDKQLIGESIKKKIESLNLPEKVYYGGVPIMLSDISNLIISDIVWLFPIVFILIALVLFLSFKSARGVILPLLTAGVAVIWTIGLMVLLGYELNMISSCTPVILLAVGTAYTIHVLNRINQTYNKDRKQSIIKALTYIIIPVVLAAVTTAIGFISFAFGAYLTMIRDFGLFTSIGTLLALLLSIFFVPAIISVFPPKKKKIEHQKAKKNFLSHYILRPLAKLLFKHPKYISATWAILILLSIGGIFFIKTSVNITSYFKEDNPTRISENILQEKFGGSLPVYVLVKGDMQNPEVLKMMSKTQDYMEQDFNIKTTQSVADLVKQMNDAMGEGLIVPNERDKIEQLWFLLDGQDIMEQLVSDELDEGIIQSRFASIESETMSDFVKYMDEFILENSTEECTIEITGLPHIYEKLNDSLLKSQFSSLLIAIIMILIIVSLILKSFSKGVYATIPIIVTITVLFGFMGITGIPLDIATVLVASVALGIGIDYSIHVITHFNHSLKETGEINKAIENTIMISGKAIIINVISVAIGFLVLIFSQLTPLQNFGLLVTLSMIGSGLASLTLLPVILILSNRKKKITAK